MTGEQGLKGGEGELRDSQGGACRALGTAHGKGLGQEGQVREDMVKSTAPPRLNSGPLAQAAIRGTLGRDRGPAFGLL